MTSKWDAAVVAGTQTIERVVTITDPTTGSATEVSPSSGAVVERLDDDIRASFSITLPASLAPVTAEDLTAPYGNEVTIEAGFRFDDGTVETVPVGTYRTDAYATTAGDGTEVLQISGNDRSSWLIDPPGITQVFPAGATLGEVIAQAATIRHLPVILNLPTLDTVCPRLVFGPDANWWAKLRKLATDAGQNLHFDRAGQLTAAPTATFDDEPVATYRHGDECVLLQVRRGADVAASVFSGVIVTAQGSGLAVPLRSVVTDNDVKSPTQHGGKFGRRLDPVTTSNVLTQSQCDLAAEERWRRIRGAAEQVSWQQIVDPRRTSGDVIAATIGIDDRLVDIPVVLDSVTIPISPADPMSASGRRRFL